MSKKVHYNSIQYTRSYCVYLLVRPEKFIKVIFLNLYFYVQEHDHKKLHVSFKN